MTRFGRWCRWAVMVWCGLLFHGSVMAMHEDPIRLGILAFRPKEVEAVVWRPMAEAIRQALPERELQMRLLDLPELEKAVQSRQVDFVLTNPGHYVLLARREGLTNPLATLVRKDGQQKLRGFGGVALVQADSPIDRWEDLRGKHVAIVSESSLGGYQMQAYAMQQRGMDVQTAVHWMPTGFPHDKVVQALLDGKADAGFVRDGLLEDLLKSGQIRPGQLKVINQQDLPDFPHRVSTPLYPEWPIAALSSTDAVLQRELAVVLLKLDQHPALQQSPDLAGFELPQSYTSIEDLLRSLRIAPFGLPELSLRETLRLHRTTAFLVGAAMLLLATGLVVLTRQRLRLRALVKEQAVMLDELAIAAETFESTMGVLITNGERVIQRVNHAFCEITGYAAEEVIGRTPSLLKSGHHGPDFYAAMAQSLDESDRWQGEIWNQRKNGEVFPEWLSISAVRDNQGDVIHYVAIFSDITWRKSAEKQIEQLAFYDPLTGLANRRLLLDRLTSALAASHRSGLWGALLFLDLDHFKEVNDTLGHEAGDRVLEETAHRLRHVLREIDTAGRLGGDEFLVLIEASHPDRDAAAEAAKTVAEKLLASLLQPFEAGKHTLTVSASIGISLYCHEHQSAEGLLKQADLAMYQVKQNGRNNVCFFDPAMESTVRQRFALQQRLATAIERNELRLFCQPQLDAQGRIESGEILLRWQPDGEAMISPAQFIPLAEKSGLILPIGHWVLQQTCTILRNWQNHPVLGQLRLAVNVSARQFKDPRFADQVRQAVADAGIRPEQLELEITESVFLGDLNEARQLLSVLDNSGYSLALDDFGTGYSSLAYLAELPFDLIKIDQSFVARMGQTTRHEEAIVSTIITLGRHLGMRVLAEGVETPAQHQHLLAHGCHLFQGYLFSKPVPLDEFVLLVEQNVIAQS